MQSLVASHLSGSTAKDQEDYELDELRPLLAHLFAFSYAWALGGNLVHTLREAFHAHTKDVFADLLALPDGSLLDHYVEVQPGHQPAFRPWASAVPTFKRSNTSLQQQILVPTVDTVRIASIVEVCLLQRPLAFPHMRTINPICPSILLRRRAWMCSTLCCLQAPQASARAWWLPRLSTACANTMAPCRSASASAHGLPLATHRFDKQQPAQMPGACLNPTRCAGIYGEQARKETEDSFWSASWAQDRLLCGRCQYAFSGNPCHQQHAGLLC